MPDFESGVASYIHGQATVDVYFPVDKREVRKFVAISAGISGATIKRAD